MLLRKKRSLVLAGLGLAIICGKLGLARASQDRDLAAADDHVLASLSYSEGHNLDSPCDYYKNVFRITLYADGRVTELSSVQGTACGPDGKILQRGHLGAPHDSHISREQLGRLAEQLRQARREAVERMAQEPRLTDEDLAAREMAKKLYVAVSEDEVGMFQSLDLPSATDVSEGSSTAWQRIQAEIRELEVN